MLLASAVAAFVPVTAVADVTTSKGSKYRVETCFISPDHLATGFFYPDRETTFVMRGGKLQVAETGKAETSGGASEWRVAFGHNFHAIVLNAGQFGKGKTIALPFGGDMTVIARKGGLPAKIRFNNPDTTPYELTFSDWRGKTPMPYRMALTHQGVTYDYRYRTVERRCDLY